MVEITSVKLEYPEGMNIILGQSHFIKTVEDIYEALVNSVPGIQFGLAFCEASQKCLVRKTGTDKELVDMAAKNCLNLSTGHAFLIILKGAFPINVLNAIKNVPEVVNIFCATANPVEVIIGETDEGRGILGVIDGHKSQGIEDEEESKERYVFLRQIGYKR